MKLGGDNALHRALEAFYGEADPYPTYEKNGRMRRRRGAWRCPVCDRGAHAPHTLTVALDADGDPPTCSVCRCSERAIWEAFDRKRTPHRPSASLRKRTPVVPPTRKRTQTTLPSDANGVGNTHRDERRSEEYISEGVISLDISKGVVGEGTTRDQDRDPKVATSRNEARARVLRLPSVPDIDFACVLPGHGHAARLVATERGLWWYQCAEHGRLSLAQVRAAIAIGRVAPLSGTLASRWLERLDYEAGLRGPRPVSITVAANWTEATAKVACGIALFLGYATTAGSPNRSPSPVPSSSATAKSQLTKHAGRCASSNATVSSIGLAPAVSRFSGGCRRSHHEDVRAVRRAPRRPPPPCPLLRRPVPSRRQSRQGR